MGWETKEFDGELTVLAPTDELLICEKNPAKGIKTILICGDGWKLEKETQHNIVLRKTASAEPARPQRRSGGQGRPAGVKLSEDDARNVLKEYGERIRAAEKGIFGIINQEKFGGKSNHLHIKKMVEVEVAKENEAKGKKGK